MPTVQELEKQLADAKALEKQAHKDKLEYEAKLLLKKCFYKPALVKGYTGFNAIKFVSCKWDTFDKDALKLFTHSVNCVYNPITKDTQISRSKKDYSGFTYTGNSQFYEWTSLDNGLFTRLWDIVGGVGVAIIDEANPNMPLLDKYVNASISLMDELRDDDMKVVMDVPYLQLAGWETSILPAAFQLHGNRYLLTPESRRVGIQKLDQEFTSLYRGSHLFEACDMGYVNSRRDTINKLRTALSKF